ncbi:MAG: T9SS type A sorting domain-containing protein [Bacteroidetes bacterium]|nr:T9SS type A sorting domain-containing protein [Bacteroidota bacterium]
MTHSSKISWAAAGIAAAGISVSAWFAFTDKSPEPKPLPAPLVVKQILPDTAGLFDSMMRLQVTLPPILEKAQFDEVAAKEFTRLARETGGKFTLIRDVQEVVGSATSIIRRNLRKGTDVLLLVDKTGSMDDDIASIKVGLHKIVNALKKEKDIRCGMAFYGDKNNDDNWFNYLDFSKDFDSLQARIEDVKAEGGGDMPESVYDGFFEAHNKMNWDSTRRRMVILIGDAPSLDSNLAEYQLEDVIRVCRKHNISTNLYPMLLATNDGERAKITKPKTADLIGKVYPNPGTGPVTVEMSNYGTYEIQVYNQAGALLQQWEFSGKHTRADLSAYAPGLYLLRTIQKETRTVETARIVLQK